MAFPSQFLDDLVARSDIVDVVGEYVPLTQKGGRYWACCPFHSEKTPSFTVSPDLQIYKCFGCGKGGGVINFVMQMENLSFADAVAKLARRANLEVPVTGRSDPGAGERRRRLLEINREAARIFHRLLWEPEGAEGLAYFRQRGLSRQTLTRFGLGFAPASWDGFFRLMGEKGYDRRDLLQAGLASASEDGRIYGRFRNRVIFPIIDVRDEVIGFGGRVLDDAKPKYLNSPDTPVYNKSRNMFALNVARKSRAGEVILTEGYMDTIALHQAGFDNAVASLGTSLTEDHCRLLSRYFRNVILSYDGDEAGVKAAQRAIPLLERAGLKVRVLQVTGAKDPDEYIKAYGRDAFARLLDSSENQVDYRLRQIAGRYNLQDDPQRVSFVQESAQMLSTLSSDVEREIFGRHAAQIAGISPETMEREVRRSLEQRRLRQRQRSERQEMDPAARLQPAARSLRYGNLRSAPAEEGIIRLGMLDPSLVQQMDGLTGEEFSSPALGKIFDLIRDRAARGLSTQPAVLAGELTQEEMDQLTRIAIRPVNAANSQQAIRDYVSAIRQEGLLRRTDMDPDEQLRAIQQSHLAKKSCTEGTP